MRYAAIALLFMTFAASAGEPPDSGNAPASNVPINNAPPDSALGSYVPVSPVILPPYDRPDIVAFEYANERLFAYTSGGSELQLRDDGTWDTGSPRVDSGTSPPLRYLAGRIAVDAHGSIVTRESVVRTLQPVNAVAPSAFWAVGDAGRIYRYGEKEGALSQMPSGGTTENLYAIDFDTEKRHAAIAGEKGLILTSSDGGASWQRRTTSTALTLRAVSLPNADTIVAAGTGGVILKSENGGATWTHITREPSPLPAGIPLPAPWYILVNLLITVPALVLAARGRPSEDSIDQSESIADRLVSDRALKAGEPDALNLGAIALGLSRFLRNEKTVPPLTVAITGEWGSGKSSLMNLLEADLSEFGFRPVWFNAWHHQKEQHFLASLVQAIRNDAAPPWWHIPFRAKLLWLRSKRHPGTVALLLLVIAILFGYESGHDDHRITATIVGAFREGTLAELLVGLPSTLKDEFAILISIAGALGALWKGLRSFAAKPAALLATVSSQASLQDLDKEISFRGRFAPEFRDVTTALGDRPLVLFIDDLDRCQPDSVKEMLEAINYLMTSGNCFIILGIDRTRIERYVKLAFAHAAQDEPEFAANYLDKLINIEVPVPAPNDREAMQILTPPETSDEMTPTLERLRAAMAWAWRLKPAMFAALILILGMSFGSALRPTPAPEMVIADSPSAIATPAQTTPVTQAAALTINLSTGTPGTAIAGEMRSRAWGFWPIALLLASTGAVAVWLFTRKPGLVVHDSEEFVAALEAWQPLLVARNRTPRSLKRFINRVRYLAMRQRPQEEEATMWRALRAALTGKRIPPPLVPDTQPIPEADLVALAAMTYASRDGKDHERELQLSIARHEARFGHLEQHRWVPQFERICSDVRVN